MKASKLNDYKKMDVTALEKELKSLKQELFKLRFSHAMNGLENPNKIVATKKNIARVNTVITVLKNGGHFEIKEEVKKPVKKEETKKTVKKEEKPKASKKAKEESKVGGKD